MDRMKDDYEINEKDIESVIKYLKIHNPENADREYAIQLLNLMQNSMGQIARSVDLTDEQIQKAIGSEEV
jgi:DNA-binding phage protein